MNQNKTYTKEEVEKSTLEYFKGDQLATDVWVNKYSLKDDKNYYELNPDDMHRRLAKEFARIEKKYPNPLNEDEIFNLFKNFKYIVPQGRVMAGLGVTKSYRSLSNCLVLPTPNDAYSSIMYTDTMLVNSAKRGCGYGIDLSKLRPNGSTVKNAAITSTGIIPFMERFSNSTREVGQDSRRGACLLGIDIEHPQSMDFTKSKLDRTKITGANISLKVSDVFMNSVKDEQQFDLKFNNEVYSQVNAHEYWKEIMKVIHNSSEPGIFFWDRINDYEPASAYQNHKITLTNACGEQPMGELDTCRLIVCNLSSYIDNPFTENSKFNEKKFIDHIKKQIKLGDDLVDLEIEYVDRIINKIKSDPEPIEQKIIEISLWERVKDKAIKGRRIGCGITGLGDMLASMNLIYGSKESMDFIDYIMKIKMKSELEELVYLSKERGSFPDFDVNLEFPNNKPYNSFYSFVLDEFGDVINEMKKYGRRSINWSTIAPVGTTSLLTRTTSGCEPIFNVFYKRRKKTDDINESVFKDKNGDIWSEYNVFHPKFVEWFKVKYPHIDNHYLYLNECDDITILKYINESPYYNSSANEINWVNRVKIQGILQKYTTSAISSTVNLPENVTVNEIEDIYMSAWEHKCKGITIYREGSRDGVLINSSVKKEDIFKEHHAPKRPKRLKGEIHRFQNNMEKWIAVVGLKDGHPYEIFTGKLVNGLSYLPNNIKECEIVKNTIEVNGEKKKSYDIEYINNDGEKITHVGLNHAFNPEYWNYAKLISGILRHGMPLVYVNQLIDSLNFKDDYINTWKNGVSRVIKRYIKDGEKVKGKCPECGGEQFEYKEKCLMCSNCGWSKCG